MIILYRDLKKWGLEFGQSEGKIWKEVLCLEKLLCSKKEKRKEKLFCSSIN